MKRSKKIRLTSTAKIILSVIIIGIVLCTLTFVHKDKNFETEIHEIEEKDNYTLKIDYPEITNQKINEEVLNYINEKKELFLDTSKELKEITSTPCDLSITYTVEDLFDFKALHINVNSYTGGAHYIKENKSYYFNEKTGEEVTIEDFLEENKLEELSKLAYFYAIQYYTTQNKEYDEEWIKEGTKAKIENYSHFSITKDGLILLFMPYQIGPYSDGEITILIPEKELKGIIKKEYLSLEEEVINIKEPEKRDLEKYKDKKLLAFTFDDGPSDGPTNKLLDNLEKYDARVSFFVLGSRVNTYSKSLKRAYEMGNTIGSHTYSHLNLFQLKDYDIMKEINNTNEVIEGLLGFRPDKLRAPYGNTNTHIKELSNMYTILWDIDTEDWKYKDAEKIKDNIIKHAHDGAIILLHDIYTTSVDGALLAMEELKEEYAFVSIDEMIELKGLTLDKTKSYFSF
ncbi:secreted deoxyriboendonuclease [Mycoplasma sp. CAG:776]|nr:secreted deoxyriboendonuclease [Mycoplasma sp. CAG:776]